MKPCPHCSALNVDAATECNVCHKSFGRVLTDASSKADPQPATKQSLIVEPVQVKGNNVEKPAPTDKTLLNDGKGE
jgi:hypothetical protein